MGRLEILVAVVIGFLPVGAVWLSVQSPPAWFLPGGDLIILPAMLLAYGVWIRRGWMRAAAPLTIVSGAFALVSWSTGYLNGLTDEAYSTPRYFGLLPNLYGHPAPEFTYQQYGVTLVEPARYVVYLPGLVVVYALPISAVLISLVAWAAASFIVRKDCTALFFVGGPFPALMAANGYNDAVPLFLLTLGFVGLSERRGRILQLLSTGFKQFANVLTFAYWAFRRDWTMATGTVIATALWLIPFLFLSTQGTICHAVLGVPDVGASCSPRSGLLDYHNYLLYPAWALGVFGPRFLRHLRSPRFEPHRRRAATLLGIRENFHPHGLMMEPLVLLLAWFLSFGRRSGA